MTSLPPATHVYVGKRLMRIDALTLAEAQAVIVRLCDEVQDARDELQLLKRQPPVGPGNLMTPSRKRPP